MLRPPQPSTSPQLFRVRERAATPQFVQVALPLPLFQTFTYAIEDGLSNPVRIGSRVVVPLRNDKEVGICVGVSEASPLKRKPKAVVESPDVEPAIGASLLELCKWMADYYVVPLGVCSAPFCRRRSRELIHQILRARHAALLVSVKRFLHSSNATRHLHVRNSNARYSSSLNPSAGAPQSSI